jgi:hypothetical protein
MTRRNLLLATTVAVLLGSATLMYLQRTRTIEGTWFDLFEGSTFFEGQGVQQACGKDFNRDGAWFQFRSEDLSIDHRMLQEYADSSRFVSEHGTWQMGVYSVRFVGRKKYSLPGFGFGHLGSFGSQVEVDRMISMSPITGVRCDIR